MIRKDGSSVWRIIRLTDHLSKYKHKTNYPDQLRKKILREQIRLNRRTTQIVRLDAVAKPDVLLVLLSMTYKTSNNEFFHAYIF